MLDGLLRAITGRPQDDGQREAGGLSLGVPPPRLRLHRLQQRPRPGFSCRPGAWL